MGINVKQELPKFAGAADSNGYVSYLFSVMNFCAVNGVVWDKEINRSSPIYVETLDDAQVVRHSEIVAVLKTGLAPEVLGFVTSSQTLREYVDSLESEFNPQDFSSRMRYLSSFLYAKSKPAHLSQHVSLCDMLWAVRLKSKVFTSEIRMIPIVANIPSSGRWQSFLDRALEAEPGCSHVSYSRFVENVRMQAKKPEMSEESTTAALAASSSSNGFLSSASSVLGSSAPVSAFVSSGSGASDTAREVSALKSQLKQKENTICQLRGFKAKPSSPSSTNSGGPAAEMFEAFAAWMQSGGKGKGKGKSAVKKPWYKKPYNKDRGGGKGGNPQN